MSIVETTEDGSADTGQQSLANTTRPAGSRRRRLTQDEERAIARLYAETSTPTAEIRERFGIGESSLYRVVQRHGVALRGRTGPSTQSQPPRTTTSAARPAKTWTPARTPDGQPDLQGTWVNFDGTPFEASASTPAPPAPAAPNPGINPPSHWAEHDARPRASSWPMTCVTRCAKRSRSERSKSRRSPAKTDSTVGIVRYGLQHPVERSPLHHAANGWKVDRPKRRHSKPVPCVCGAVCEGRHKRSAALRWSHP